MRKAASLIELIISIVVMGVAIMSLPLILTQSQRSNEIALQQEIVLATKTKLGYILAYEWDANSYDINASISRVLNTTGTAADNEFDAPTILRTGHINADNRRRLRDDFAQASGQPTTKANFGSNALTDIDDFNGKVEPKTIVQTDMDYIFNLDLNTTVNYISDSTNYTLQTITFDFNATNTNNNPTNIKMIEVRTTDTNNPDTQVIMRAFASNIGESRISKKDW